jgi:DNA polymerase-3 subunit alpha
VSKLVHLHRHGEFSLLDGVGTAEHYAQRAADLNQSALALTDHGSLAGVLYHVNACEKVGVKPIIGAEMYLTHEAQKHDKEHKRYHLVLLAKNPEGFRNLMRLSSLSWQPENFYYKPCIDWSLLRQYSEGLIASTSCLSGVVPKSIVTGQHAEAKRWLNTMQDIFNDDLYIEIQPHDDPGQRKVNLELIAMANEKGIPLVATTDAHYPYKEWFNTQDILVMIQTGQSNKSREAREDAAKDIFKFSGNTYWLMDEQELCEQFLNFHPEISSELVNQFIDNSSKIAERITSFSIDKSPKIPKATPSPLAAERQLRHWCREGLERIGKTDEQEYLDRIEEELSVMRELKVLDYFVIVADMVRWAKDQGIRVGPGRGSAAGSLVNYLCRITSIDPIGYGLLFERFLNSYRTELPDIDIDFQDDRRDEVKQYLHDKYGDDYVVNVASFQSFKPRAAIQEVSRVLNIPSNEVRKATNVIPTILFEDDLESLEASYPDLKAFLDKYPQVRTHATRLEGQISRQSQHPAAVIITDRPAIDVIPMMQAKDGGMVTQWSERANAQLISPYGFLKIDCLSTDALTLQHLTLEKIKERTGHDIDFEDPKQFPVIESPYRSDDRVIESFTDGHNVGVFQFASNSIIGLLRHVKPTNLDHVIATNALHRPGTLVNGVAFEYGDRKNGKTYWTLPHEAIKPFVQDTFGFMVYQEQVMQIFRALALDASDADVADFLKVTAKGIARDLGGKKKLQAYYDQFAAGCTEKKIPQRAYDEIWQQILQMTTYSFNKSHAAGYSLQAYQDKWLKTYYPLEFYSSLLTVSMNSSGDSQKKVVKAIREANAAEVKILPPDINSSDVGFTIDGNAIRFGLQAIKYVGREAVEEIKAQRPFESYGDFYDRVEKKKLNKRAKKMLVAAGAFDSLGGRSEWILDEESMVVDGSISDADRATSEKELMGFSVSGTGNEDKYLKTLSEYVSDNMDGDVQIGGEVIGFREITDKNSKKMAFVNLSYNTTEHDVTFFSDTYAESQHLLTEGNFILVVGRYDPQYKSTVARKAISVAKLMEE